MQAAGHHHHHSHHHGQHHSRRWGSGTISMQEQQQPSSYTHSNNNNSAATQYAVSHNNNNNMQVATTLTTTTTSTHTQQQLLPAPPPPPPPASSLSNNSTRLGLPSPSSSALNIYSYHHHSQYGTPSKRHGRAHISEDEKEEIRMAFELFDSNKTGKLSYRELKVAMRALDFDVHKVEVKRLMEENTKDGNTDEVDMDEFMDILISKYKERDPDEELSKAFKLFDEDGTGKITLKNLRKLARDLGEHIPEEELGAMIEEFDNDQDGGINEVEFYNIMKADDFDD